MAHRNVLGIVARQDVKNKELRKPERSLRERAASFVYERPITSAATALGVTFAGARLASLLSRSMPLAAAAQKAAEEEAAELAAAAQKAEEDAAAAQKAAQEADSSSAIINSIIELDKLYATYKVNMEYKWEGNGTLSEALLDKVQKVRGESTWWHGGFSLARILAQYAAEHNLRVTDFSANLLGESTTEALLTNVTPDAARAMDEATYLTYCIVSAIHLQSFGALFTSQPHFNSKPMDELKYAEENMTYNKPKPDCKGSRTPIELSTIDERPAQIDHNSLVRAIALISRLIDSSVLIAREPPLDTFKYEFHTSLDALDQRLRAIDQGLVIATFDPEKKSATNDPMYIERYTRGLAGNSTAYSQMRKTGADVLLCVSAHDRAQATGRRQNRRCSVHGFYDEYAGKDLYEFLVGVVQVLAGQNADLPKLTSFVEQNNPEIKSHVFCILDAKNTRKNV